LSKAFDNYDFSSPVKTNTPPQPAEQGEKKKEKKKIKAV
jgi:hypothetical protein